MTKRTYTATFEDGSTVEVYAINNAKARAQVNDHIRFVLGYMSQDVKPRFSCKEAK